MLGGAGGLSPPPVVETIVRETEALGFAMASEARVDALLGQLEQRRGFVRVELDWASGIVIVVRRIEAKDP